MWNIVDYVENQMAGLAEKPFNPVDSLVLSQLSYVYFTSLIPGLARNAEPVRIGDLLRAECFSSMFNGVRDHESNRRLLFALAASPRFRDVKANYYVDELDSKLEKQFSAVTFFLDEETAYIAFRGTDATFTGWKEDFNMAFISPVPSQEDALRYLEYVAGRFSGSLIVGGHSKGGNLAVYSAMRCAPKVRGRILRVYSHDGPGFKDNIFESGEYRRVSALIHKTLPQSSLIGMLLENQEDYYVVESKGFGGLMQHDPFSWAVEEDDFHVLKQLSPGAQYLNKTLSDWLGAMSDEEREQFTDALYSVLISSSATSFAEFSAQWQKDVPVMLAAAKNIESENGGVVTGTLKALAVLALKNIPHPRWDKFGKKGALSPEKLEQQEGKFNLEENSDG